MMSFNIAHEATQIRAKFPSIKGMGSLQIAASVLAGYDLFLTNDKKLRQFGILNLEGTDMVFVSLENSQKS